MNLSIQELAQLGYSACEIADIKNCSTQAVRNFCKKRNILIQKKEEPDITESFKNYFKNKINIQHEDACWNWQGAVDRSGYGVLFYKNKTTFAHRVAYKLYKDNEFNAYVPENITKESQVILHSCDNPICCNPKHLSIGTPKDNTLDMILKKRAKWQKEM